MNLIHDGPHTQRLSPLFHHSLSISYNKVQYNAMQYSAAMWCNAMQCNSIQYDPCHVMFNILYHAHIAYIIEETTSWKIYWIPP